MSGKFCPGCGRQLDANAQFCTTCGRPLAGRPAPAQTGNTNVNGNRYPNNGYPNSYPNNGYPGYGSQNTARPQNASPLVPLLIIGAILIVVVIIIIVSTSGVEPD